MDNLQRLDELNGQFENSFGAKIEVILDAVLFQI